jgi:hypothetical protein
MSISISITRCKQFQFQFGRCAHHWDIGHAPSVPAYKGKENFPTVSYNVTCEHARRAMSAHGLVTGARKGNKKNVRTYRMAVRAVTSDIMCLNFRYQ